MTGKKLTRVPTDTEKGRQPLKEKELGQTTAASSTSRWIRYSLLAFVFTAVLQAFAATHSVSWLRDSETNKIQVSYDASKPDPVKGSVKKQVDDGVAHSFPTAEHVDNQHIPPIPPSQWFNQTNAARFDTRLLSLLKTERSSEFHSECLVASLSKTNRTWNPHLIPDATMLRLQGFETCIYLNNAAFDARTWIHHSHSTPLVPASSIPHEEDLIEAIRALEHVHEAYTAPDDDEDDTPHLSSETPAWIQQVLRSNAHTLEKEFSFPDFRSTRSQNHRLPSHPARQIDPCHLVALIEHHARAVSARVQRQSSALGMGNFKDPEDLLRFSCYEAAVGVSAFLGDGFVNSEKYDDGKSAERKPFLVHVDGPTYFPFLDGMRADYEAMARLGESLDWCRNEHGPSPEQGMEIVEMNKEAGKPHFKIAYLLLGYTVAGNVQSLLDRLWHPSDVIVGIHIDLENQEIRAEVEKYVLENYPNATNIMFIDPVRVYWGHISIVFAQLRGFFQLLNKASWDHIINLSETDYPLATNQQIHNTLRKNVNYIEWYHDTARGHQTRRLQTLCLRFDPNEVKCSYDSLWNAPKEAKRYLTRQFPCNGWNLEVKNSQWMILSQAFVETLRVSPTAANLLAYSEHVFIPDESYFALIAEHTPWGKSYFEEIPAFANGTEDRGSFNGTVGNNVEGTNGDAGIVKVERRWSERRNHRLLKFNGPHPWKLNIQRFERIAKEKCGNSAVLDKDNSNAGKLYCNGTDGEMSGHAYFFVRKIHHLEEKDWLVKYIDEHYNLGSRERLAQG
ncbi:core-2/I-branching enzyme-domain-containing protein [Cladochytrium replicatum]|nr:core-2/I-branching enzyme-domain-containing protein [Cladochytrium replicatum]